MSLSEKSNEEISSLLTEYGIKHGPIVGSTRKLYEKKLEKAMEEAPVKPSSDKTYYREEEEEITYVTYHNPAQEEVYTNVLKRRGNALPGEEEEDEEEEDEESDQDTEPPVQVTYRAANRSAVRSGGRSEATRKTSGGGLWKVIRMLLLLAVLAAVCYYAYCHLMNNDKTL
ncbi:emerin (Emery-Dreifuss muscular dystrophy) [Amphiprion ocellaris]|uniref:emerin (Emery-Dreifuss muscular dystrophy) n=1 Tax=Amphiprion ocellaris TaxID=80972 RepID=UPI000C3111E4|nr:emerin (Emery-Dreifuss muscular dystrophy) [Amphiprion ocellaris]